MTTRAVTLAAANLITLSISLALPAQAETLADSSAGTLKAEVIASGLDHPWAVAFLPDGGYVVTERPGRMRIVRDGKAGPVVAGLPDVRTVGQGGLLDVVLAPDFADSQRIYFSFSEKADDAGEPEGQGTAIASARLIVDGMEGSLEGMRVIFRQNKFTTTGHHFGSRIAIAPDGNLFFTIGDRGEGDRAQNGQDHAGSVLRIRPDGGIPEDNPNATGGLGAEIWSMGHRNPQGVAIDPADGTLWTVEHGARGGDELNHPEAGKNYGWPEISYGVNYNGSKIGVGTEAPGMEQPVYYWDPSIAPSGLAFYDGDLIPEWKGDLLVGALKFQMLVRLDMEDGKVVKEERLFEKAFGRIRDVRVGPDGAIYLLSDEDDGQLIRVAPAD